MDTTDEFASFFVEGEIPKIVITTTRRPHSGGHQFAEELADMFPLAEYRKRPSNALVSDIVKSANERGYTHLFIVNESRGDLDSLSIIKLPIGPTAHFTLTSVKLGKTIHNHGRSTAHTPELILNNFVTKLGHRVGRLFVSLFPHVPQFQGRQVVTFHNQRDFIFVRRHRYIFEDGVRVRMQEIGPQFTLKLKKMYKATCHLKDAEMEYEWKSHAVDSKKFAL
jgi:ribosome production factor 1